jgi:hypothetical protein
MPTLTNPRHESFAQELARGHSKAEALSRAGYGGSRSCASRLSANANIRSRVAELQANATVSTLVTIEQLTFELEQARQLAMARGNASAAVVAVIAKAKLHGLINGDRAVPVQNSVVEGASERQESPREIARLIAFALAIGRRQIDQQGRD